jgi:hypothetical protein
MKTEWHSSIMCGGSQVQFLVRICRSLLGRCTPTIVCVLFGILTLGKKTECSIKNVTPETTLRYRNCVVSC